MIDQIKNNKIYILFFLFILVKGLIWTWAIPPFLAPDELPHFAYTQYLVEEKKIPKNTGKITPLTTTKSEELKEAAELLQINALTSLSSMHMVFLATSQNIPLEFQTYARNVSPKNYKNSAAIYSPLYYAYGAVPYIIGKNLDVFHRLYLMRLFSLTFLFLTIVFAYKIAFLIMQDRLFAFTVATIITLMPSVNATSFAGINNDAALIAFAHILFYHILKVWRDCDISYKNAAWLAIFFSLTLLSKPQGAIFFPLIVLAYTHKWIINKNTKKTILSLLIIVIIAGSVALPFYLRSFIHYNESLIQNIKHIDPRQISPAKNILTSVLMDAERRFFLIITFWTQLQFFTLYYSNYIHVSILFLIAFAVAGYGPYFNKAIRIVKKITMYNSFFSKRRKQNRSIPSGRANRDFDILKLLNHRLFPIFLCICVFLILDLFYTLLYYRNALSLQNYNFPTQGRYYFVIIGPIIILFLLGIERFFSRFKIAKKNVYAGLIIFFIFLHNYALFNIAIQYNYL